MTKRNLIGLVVLCSVLLAAGACGKKKGGAAGANKLVGTWKFDGNKTVAATEMFKKGKPEMKAQFAAMLDKATLEITKDKMKVTGLGPKVQEDTYKVTKTDGKTLTIESVDEKGKKETMTITFISDTEIRAEKKEKMGQMVFFAKKQ